jgi:hypothetical protein
MPSAADALAGLRDIHLPDPVAFFPLAPGWWGLIVMFLVAALALLWLGRRRRRSARRAALHEIQRLEEAYAETHDAPALASGLSALLRRVSLLRGERETVATLQGEARALAVARVSGGFSPGLLGGLEAAVYQNPARPVPAADARAWLEAARAFIGRAS